MTTTEFDIIVVGAGPGGYPAAISAAHQGKRTAIIEMEHPGGVCLNSGCIPTKAFLASAERVQAIRHAAEFGIEAAPPVVHFDAMLERKNALLERMRQGIRGLLKSAGVTFIQGTAQLESPTTLSVAHDPSLPRDWYSARHIILATGSLPMIPGFIPRHPRVIDSTAFLAGAAGLPANLLILGGGVIGCELACMTAALGTKVTLVEKLDDILPMLDRDIRRVMRDQLKALGITIITGASLEDIKGNDNGVTARAGDTALSADYLLVAIGRKPNLDTVAPERAGLTRTPQGRIDTDPAGRTPVPSLFAIGDINAASPQLAHFATSQAFTAVHAITGKRHPPEALCPACIFTFPEVGAVGLTEDQARAEGRDVCVGRFPFQALGKAVVSGHTAGFVKWIADPATDQLLGAHIVGPHATELIAEAALAIRNQLTAAEVGRTIHAHPTLSEAWMEAAHALHKSCVHLPPNAQ